MAISSVKTDYLIMLNFTTSLLPKFLGKKKLALYLHIFLIMTELSCMNHTGAFISTLLALFQPSVSTRLVLSQCNRRQCMKWCVYLLCKTSCFIFAYSWPSLSYRNVSPTVNRIASAPKPFILIIYSSMSRDGFVSVKTRYIHYSGNMNSVF